MKRRSNPAHDERKILKVYYDGQCALCRGLLRRYSHADRQGRLQWLDANVHLDELGKMGIPASAALGRIHVIESDGGIKTGAAAIAAIWSRLSSLRFRLLAALLRLPGAMAIAESVYDFIATHRSRRSTP
jgi:predicted DCC family thiol-disulfide oxidoreductase YuxK